MGTEAGVWGVKSLLFMSRTISEARRDSLLARVSGGLGMELSLLPQAAVRNEIARIRSSNKRHVVFAGFGFMEKFSFFLRCLLVRYIMCGTSLYFTINFIYCNCFMKDRKYWCV